LNEHIDSLRRAIKHLYRFDSTHVRTEKVSVVVGGNVWNGEVGVFLVVGHPTIRECYAWGIEEQNGQWRYVAVLGIHPVDSARKAVQAFFEREPRQPD